MNREHASQLLGRQGVSLVQLLLKDRGWVVFEDASADIGLDLHALIRDKDGYEPGTMLGLQVKTGPSYFNRPGNNDSGEVGWWFEARREKFDFWLDYEMPTILVLVDYEERVAYWERVTNKNVCYLQKDAKIFVPSTQKIDADGLDELEKISSQSGVLKEGWPSLWIKHTEGSWSKRVRTAMLLPRLVASRYSAQETMTPDMAIALLLQGEISLVRKHTKAKELGIAHLPTVPELLEVDPAEKKWWRLFDLLYSFLVEHDHIESDEIALEFESSSEAIPFLVATSVLNQIDEKEWNCYEELSPYLEDKNVLPIDRAWLHIQVANYFLNCGQREDGYFHADSARVLISAHAYDLTALRLEATAQRIVSACGVIESSTKHNERRAELVNSVSLWSSNSFARALEEQSKRDFEKWSEDKTIHLGRNDMSYFHFRTGGFAHLLSGDRGAYEQFAKYLGQYLVSRNQDQQILSNALLLMLDSNAEKETLNAAFVLYGDGREDVVLNVLKFVQLRPSKRYRLETELSILHSFGHLLSEVQASQLSKSIRTIIGATRIWYRRERLYLALAGVYLSASSSEREEIRNLVLADLGQIDEEEARSRARLMRAIPFEEWGNSPIDYSALGNGSHLWDLSREIQKVNLKQSEGLSPQYVERLVSGDLWILECLSSLTVLDDKTVIQLREIAVTGVQEKIQGFESGVCTQGGLDHLGLLTIINFEFPELANWIELIGGLAYANTQSGFCIGAARILLERVSEIPNERIGEFQAVIAANIERLNSGFVFGWFEDESLERILLQLNLMLSPNGVTDEMRLSYAFGSAQSRMANVSHLLTEKVDRPRILLCVMASGSPSENREFLVEYIKSHRITPFADQEVNMLRILLEMKGTAFQVAFLDGLSSLKRTRADLSAFVPLLRSLQGSRSSRVRYFVGQALADIELG